MKIAGNGVERRCFMKINKKSLTKKVNPEGLRKEKGFEKLLTKLRKGDEVWEWKVSDPTRLGAAGGFVIVRDGEPTEHTIQTFTG
jgi:hypothetical protein